MSGYFGDYERSHGYTAYNTLEDYDHHSYKGSGFGDYAGNYLHGKHYGNKSYTADHRQDFAAASVSYHSSSKSASSSTEEEEVEEEAGDKPLYVFPGKDYGDADPMPKGFNYGAYKRFNSAPHYHEREKRNNIPVRDSSSDGHRSADSHLSYTTSDEDGVYSDSDNGFNVGGAPVVREGNMIFSRRPADLQDPHHIAANFEFDSKSDNDDGYTDSIYRFSNSTSDRGEITDPLTDSAIHSPEERDFFYDHDVHGPHGTGHPGVTTITKGIPDAYDYSNLHDALWTLDRKIGNKGGIDDHKFYFRDDFKPFEGDKWGHMAFSPEWEECVDCIPGHPGHRHHVLDHPDDPNSPDHNHTDLVDDKGWPLPKPLHNHDKPQKPTPPAENLENAAIARQYLHYPEEWLTAEEVPDKVPHPGHHHHVLDHDEDEDHRHDFLVANMNLEHGQEPFEEPDHTHEKPAKPTPPPESRELAKFFMDGNINEVYFD